MTSPHVVSTLGTLHDIFLSNPNYGLKEFTSALYQFKPDMILSEVLPESSTAGDASIDGGIEQSLVYAYAKEHSIPVIATDWFDGDFIREMEEENSKVTDELIETLQEMSEFRKSFESDSLLDLNSARIKNLVREIYKVFETNGLLASRKRNERILTNIKSELKKSKSQRVLVIYGMDHKFFIDDHLANVEGVKVVEVSSWFKADVSQSYKMTDSFRAEVLKNLEISEALLEKRLKSKHYSRELAEKLKAKLPRFEVWMDAVSEL